MRRIKLPSTRVDFSQVEDFEPLEKGEYLCMIEEVRFVQAQSEDKYDYLNVQLVVTEDGEYKDRKLWKVWSFSPRALWRMKQDLENIGVETGDFDVTWDEETDLVTEPELAGMPVLAVVTQRTWEGKVQNQVDALLDSGDSTPRKAPTNSGKKTTTGAKKKFQ